MDTEWLRDFLAIEKFGVFTVAADERNITQSALSRRIRSLEERIGGAAGRVELFDRSASTRGQLTLTPAGELFLLTANQIIRTLESGCAAARDITHNGQETLRFASTQAVSRTFFPTWIKKIKALKSAPKPLPLALTVSNMVDCERKMLDGDVQFLLCHHVPAQDAPLKPTQFIAHCCGDDVLVPVSAPTSPNSTTPKHALPGAPQKPVAYLGYGGASGMGRIVRERLNSPIKPIYLGKTFESHLAAALVDGAVAGDGLAWSPMSLVSDLLATGELVRAGPSEWDIHMDIHVIRPRERLSPTAEEFWSLIKTPT